MEQCYLILSRLVSVHGSRSNNEIWKSINGPEKAFCQRLCLDFFFVFFLHAVKKVYLLICLLSTPGIYNVFPLLVYNKNALSVFIMCLLVLLCCVFSSPDGNVAAVSPIQPSLGWWWSQLPHAQPSLPGKEGGEWPRDGRVSSTEQEPQLQSAKVMQNWNTLVKLKFVLIPSVGNTVNENRSNQIKIIYFISLRHCKTFQGSRALLCKPEIDAVPLFTSKTTKVKTFKCIKAILLIVSIEDSPLPFLVKHS